MRIAWLDLAAALGLLLVIEGVLPFLSPARLRRALQHMSAMGDATLRVAGAACMLAGVIVLWLVRG
jgi:uncharacterized protein